MPTYEYICGSCGHEFEQSQGITAKALRRCPKCGRSKLKRLIGTGVGILFKGSGFYQTDYRSESYKKAEKSEKSSGDTAKTDKKTDTKSETRTEPKTPTADKKKSARTDVLHKPTREPYHP